MNKLKIIIAGLVFWPFFASAAPTSPDLSELHATTSSADNITPAANTADTAVTSASDIGNTSFAGFCTTKNANNFTYQQNQSLYDSGIVYSSWGPDVNTMQQRNLIQKCSNNASWAQSRAVYSANYWVKQKFNYCHHYVPTWFPRPEYQLHSKCGDTENDRGSINIYPGNTYLQPIRWNYDGKSQNQTQSYWQDKGQWYGADCSNFTALIYNWGFGKRFSSDVQVQGGQALGSTDYPNEPGFSDEGVRDGLGRPAGNMVCADGTTAPLPTTSYGCDRHGGFISVFDTYGNYKPAQVTPEMLKNLQPGDLIYLATVHSSHEIEHVVMWTGQKVGGGVIDNSQLAPNQFCSQDDWYYPNNNGKWIIVDSTYQGADYRIFSDCFYRSSIWGVRRVLNVSN